MKTQTEFTIWPSLFHRWWCVGYVHHFREFTDTHTLARFRNKADAVAWRKQEIKRRKIQQQ